MPNAPLSCFKRNVVQATNMHMLHVVFGTNEAIVVNVAMQALLLQYRSLRFQLLLVNRLSCTS